MCFETYSARVALLVMGVLAAGCSPSHAPSSRTVVSASPASRAPAVAPSQKGRGGVFVLGGIHQTHERAEKYTYARLGEVFTHLAPDVLCVEANQRFVADGSNKGMPRDFALHILPLARKRKIPVFGIDNWTPGAFDSWQKEQRKAAANPALRAEVMLIGGLFRLLNDYFVKRDFAEINDEAITALWRAKSELKYRIYRSRPAYRSIWEFERKRNDFMVAAVKRAIRQHPGRRILVAVGIDHKYYIEQALRDERVRVLTVAEAKAEWWR